MHKAMHTSRGERERKEAVEKGRKKGSESESESEREERGRASRRARARAKVRRAVLYPFGGTLLCQSRKAAGKQQESINKTAVKQQ